MSNLAKRLIFAFTAMPIVAFLLWFGDYTRWALLLFLAAASAYEWSKMVTAAFPEENFTSTVSPFCAMILTVPWIMDDTSLILPILTVVIFAYIVMAFAYIDVKNLFPWLTLQMTGPLYLGLWGGISIRLFESGQGWLQCSKFMIVMMTLWGCDSAAYFAGKYLGKRKFSPQISPKKTWEGSIGGTLFAIFWFWIWTRTGFGYTVFDISLAATLGLGFVIAVAGQLGDLLISALKRWSGIKDSGEFFPGHGGVLDRADSFYLAAPVATIILLSYYST
ncbi:MAG: phosphatidate cytidylyltransferase [Fibromonadaceae bacterium]|jgi:phosphatidate cytidylyltransferase|nr:phosphatidate cytidylyltransferase [Fibromonadaceae bacterium]